MIEKFKKLSKEKKWVVGIIAFLLFPITIMLIAAELAINGFKEGKIIKLILGIIALFTVASMIASDSSSVSKDLYDNQKVELEETISKLDKVNNELDKAKTELNDKDEVIEKAKIYLELNDDEKSKVSEFINEMKNPQDTSNKDNSNISKKSNNNSKTSSKEVNNSSSNNKSSSNVASSSSNNSSSNKSSSNVASNSSNNSSGNQSPSNTVNNSGNNSSTNLTSERIVYANGGTSTSNKYHSSPTAHNMEGAIKMTESQAKSKGYVACKRCY